MAWASKVRRARWGRQGSRHALSPSAARLLIDHMLSKTRVAARRPGRRRRLGGAGPPPRRDHQRRLARPRRRRHLPRRLPLLQPLPRRPGLRPQRPPGHARPSGWPTAGTSCRPRAGCSSATTSRPSPAPGPLVGPVLAAQFGYLPGHDLDRVRRRAGRRGAGLRHPLRLDAAGRQVARPDGQGGDRRRSPACSPWSRCSRSW